MTSSDSEVTHMDKDKDSALHAIQKSQGSITTDKVSKETAHPYIAISYAINPHITGHIQLVAWELVMAPWDPTFSTVTRIHDPKVAQMIFDQMLEILIMIMQRELFFIAPEVHAQIANATIQKCIQRNLLCKP